jgi:hypothetical protein
LDKSGSASGELFVDDGDSLQTYEAKAFTKVKFGFKKGRFRSVVEHCGYNVTQPVSDVEIYGLDNVASISNVTRDGKPVKFVVDTKLQVTNIFLIYLTHFSTIMNYKKAKKKIF